MSDFNICETVGEGGAGSSKRWFPISYYLLYTEMLGK